MKNYLLKFRNYGNNCTLGFGKELFLNIVLFFVIYFVGSISFCSSEFIGSFTCNGNSQGCGRIYAPSDCVDSFSVFFYADGHKFTVYRDGGSHANMGITGGLITSDCTYFDVEGAPGFVGEIGYPFKVSYGTDPNGGSCPDCPVCDDPYTSLECQSEYDLVSRSDLTSCQSNLSGCITNLDSYSSSLNICSSNLNSCNTSLSSCLSANCPLGSGDVFWSALYINGIQHISSSVIRVNIPEEISWDYSSSTGDFIIDVEGYNQDSDYINSIIEVQNYSPSRDDFNKVFMLFSNYSGLLVACLLVIFVFYIIKKALK